MGFREGGDDVTVCRKGNISNARYFKTNMNQDELRVGADEFCHVLTPG